MFRLPERQNLQYKQNSVATKEKSKISNIEFYDLKYDHDSKIMNLITFFTGFADSCRSGFQEYRKVHQKSGFVCISVQIQWLFVINSTNEILLTNNPSIDDLKYEICTETLFLIFFWRFRDHDHDRLWVVLNFFISV